MSKPVNVLMFFTIFVFKGDFPFHGDMIGADHIEDILHADMLDGETGYRKLLYPFPEKRLNSLFAPILTADRKIPWVDKSGVLCPVLEKFINVMLA